MPVRTFPAVDRVATAVTTRLNPSSATLITLLKDGWHIVLERQVMITPLHRDYKSGGGYATEIVFTKEVDD